MTFRRKQNLTKLALKSNVSDNFWNFADGGWEYNPTEDCLLDSTFMGVHWAEDLIKSQFDGVPDVSIVSIAFVMIGRT